MRRGCLSTSISNPLKVAGINTGVLGHSFTTTLQGQLSAFHEGEEIRTTRFAFSQVFGGDYEDLINSVPLQVGEGNHGPETPADQHRPDDKLLDRLQESCR